MNIRRTHLKYFDVLQACESPGCPICFLGQKAVKSYLDIILFESVNDPGIRDELRLSWGYCYQHAWLLPTIGVGNLPGIAVIYQDLLNLTHKTLRQGHVRRSKGLFAKLRQMFSSPKPSPETASEQESPTQASQPCPACLLRDETETLAAKVISKAFERTDAKLLQALEVSEGLCLRHLSQTLPLIRDEDARERLLTMTQTRIAALSAELGEFLRKHDYRFQHEPLGREKDSWKRALRFIVGTEEIESKNVATKSRRREE